MYRVTRFLEGWNTCSMFYLTGVKLYDTGTEPEKIWYNKEGFKIGTSRYNTQYMYIVLYTEDSKQAGPW